VVARSRALASALASLLWACAISRDRADLDVQIAKNSATTIARVKGAPGNVRRRISPGVVHLLYVIVVARDRFRGDGYEFFIQITGLAAVIGLPSLVGFLWCAWRASRADDDRPDSIS
jgi:hypothetical protein